MPGLPGPVGAHRWWCLAGRGTRSGWVPGRRAPQPGGCAPSRCWMPQPWWQQVPASVLRSGAWAGTAVARPASCPAHQATRSGRPWAPVLVLRWVQAWAPWSAPRPDRWVVPVVAPRGWFPVRPGMRWALRSARGSAPRWALPLGRRWALPSVRWWVRQLAQMSVLQWGLQWALQSAQPSVRPWAHRSVLASVLPWAAWWVPPSVLPLALQSAVVWVRLWVRRSGLPSAQGSVRSSVPCLVRWVAAAAERPVWCPACRARPLAMPWAPALARWSVPRSVRKLAPVWAQPWGRRSAPPSGLLLGLLLAPLLGLLSEPAWGTPSVWRWAPAWR